MYDQYINLTKITNMDMEKYRSSHAILALHGQNSIRTITTTKRLVLKHEKISM